MSKKNVGTSKTNKKNTCPPCMPIWPVVLLTIMGVAVIGASTWRWWGEERVREKIVKEECPAREENQYYDDKIQAEAPVAVLKAGKNFVFSTPNGLKIDLPSNSARELDYEIDAQYLIKSTGNAFDANEVFGYFALMRYSSEEVVEQALDFSIDYAADELENVVVDDGEAMVVVKYLGQTKGGQSILAVEGEGGSEGYGYNRPFVSKLKRADLIKTRYIVKRSDLWRSMFIKSTDGSGSVWSFKSVRTTDEMSAAQLAETVKILTSIR